MHVFAIFITHYCVIAYLHMNVLGTWSVKEVVSEFDVFGKTGAVIHEHEHEHEIILQHQEKEMD